MTVSDKKFTEEDAKRIQKRVDKLPDPTPKQERLKVIAQRQVANQTKPKG